MFIGWVDSLRRAVWRRHESEIEAALRRQREREAVERFCTEVLAPALDDFKQELERLGRAVAIARTGSVFEVTAWYDRTMEFDFTVRVCRRKRPRTLYGRIYGRSAATSSVPSITYSLREMRRTGRQQVCRQLVRKYRRALMPVSLAFYPWGNRHAPSHRRR